LTLEAFMGRPRLRSVVSTLICGVLAATRLGAQELRGVVRDSMSRQPIPGAVLVFLDSFGATLGRNITNERGEYRVVLHPAMRRLHVLRIGFRPRDATIPSDASGGATLDIAMVMVPHLLEATRVLDNPACSRRPDRAPAFALWEQAKAALLATIVAREANPPRVVRYSYERTMDRDGERAVHQSIFVDTAETSRPFLSADSAASFVDHGFRDDSAGIGIFHGPDADVLLDDAFARGYCFGLADRDAQRPGQIGLSFEPAKRRRNRIDITGAVWIDTASRALVDLVWKYEGLDYRLNRYDPGGRVSFRTMANGSVMIDRWSIRVVGGGSTQMYVANGERMAFAREPQVKETGGELADAQWRDGTAWHAKLAFLQGSAHLRSGSPAGRKIRLVDTPYEATIDSAGHFYMADLLPGPYEIGVVDDALTPLGLLLTSNLHFEAVRDSTVQVAFELATADAYVAATCDGDAQAFTDAVLVGRVLMPNGSPAVDAKIDVRVEENGSLRVIADGKTNNRGLFTVCRPPRNTTLFVRAELPGYNPGTGLTQIEHKLNTVELKLKPKA
jgi:hypothetical protein